MRILAPGEVTIDLGNGGSDEVITTEVPGGLPVESLASPTYALQESLPSATSDLLQQPTSTIRPTDTAIPLATDTPIPPTVTLTPLPQRACIVSPDAFVFVWQEAQLQAGDCEQFTPDIIDNGTEVMIIDEEPRSVTGPDESCVVNNFIRIESVTGPPLTGWVLQNSVQPLEPGGSC